MRTTFLLGGRIGSAFSSTVQTSEYEKIEQQKEDADAKGYGESGAIVLVVGIGENLPHCVEATVSLIVDGVVRAGSRPMAFHLIRGAHWTHIYGDVGTFGGQAGGCVFGSFLTFGSGGRWYGAGWR